MILIRSLIFQIWFYGLMIIMGILCAPLALWSREGAYYSIHSFLRLAFWGLEHFCGLKAEVRGEAPKGEVLIASKHHSFLDILILAHVLPKARFIMKRSLVWAPVLGFYALRIGASPVTRGKGRASVRDMMREADRRRSLDGQLVIYPQGTRVAPGVKAPWKTGVFLLAQSYKMPCVPVAINAGHFWPKRGILRRPGVAVVEFLEPMPEGLTSRRYLAELEARIEPACDRLSAEAKERFGV